MKDKYTSDNLFYMYIYLAAASTLPHSVLLLILRLFVIKFRVRMDMRVTDVRLIIFSSCVNNLFTISMFAYYFVSYVCICTRQHYIYIVFDTMRHRIMYAE